MTLATQAIATWRGQNCGFGKHAKALGAAHELVDDEFPFTHHYHFPDGSTALTRGQGRVFQAWESGLPNDNR